MAPNPTDYGLVVVPPEAFDTLVPGTAVWVFLAEPTPTKAIVVHVTGVEGLVDALTRWSGCERPTTVDPLDFRWVDVKFDRGGGGMFRNVYRKES